jgi:dTDP-glucose 4,6-dehydratase
MPKNVLITGGAGFIGSALCRHLVPVRGWQVTNVDKLTYAANLASLIPIASAPGYRFVQADICDRAHMDAVIAETKPDAILHLAAESHVDRSITASAEFITTNIVGTHTLLEATRAYWATLPEPRKSGFRFLHRRDCLRSPLALFRQQGCLRSFGRGLARDLRTADGHDQLF